MSVKNDIFVSFLFHHLCQYGGWVCCSNERVKIPMPETGPSRLQAHVHGTNFHHRFVAFTLLILFNVILRHFYTITLLIYIVRRPCCVSALSSP